MTISILQTEIPRRFNSCQKCLAAFSSGDSYWSILENSGRQDFCTPCWTQIPNEKVTNTQIPSARCFWKAVIPKKKENNSPAQTKIASAIDLLKDNIDQNHTEALLLALYLTRKRILIYRKDYVEGDQIFSLYEVLSTEEMIAVKKVSLRNIDLNSIKTSIASKLKEIGFFTTEN